MLSGIDVRKGSCVACIKNDEGRVLKECSFRNNDLGIKAFIQSIRCHEAGAVMEPIGTFCRSPFDVLEEGSGLFSFFLC